MDKNNQTPTDAQKNPRSQLEAIKAKIEEMKAKRAAAIDGVEDEFYANEESLLPPEIVELKYSNDPADKKQYQKALNEAKAKFEAEKMAPHDLQIAALEDSYEKKASEIDEAEKQKAIDDAKAAFLAENPGADFAAMSEFWHMDMTQRQRDAIAAQTPAGDMKGFYAAVYALMQGANGKPQDAGGEPLPPQFDGNAVAAKKPIQKGGNDAYLAAIGVR